MNTNKFLKMLLMVATLLTLLFSTACALKNEIQSTDGQALIEKGNTYMACLKESDLECAYELMSPFSQQELDDVERMVEGVVNLDTVIKNHAPQISKWTFDRAQFSTKGGTAIGSLEGQVEYMDGTHGKASLEFEKNGETWKVRSSSMNHPGF